MGVPSQAQFFRSGQQAPYWIVRAMDRSLRTVMPNREGVGTTVARSAASSVIGQEVGYTRNLDNVYYRIIRKSLNRRLIAAEIASQGRARSRVRSGWA